MMAEPKMILIMGLPGSGKTYLAKLMAQHFDCHHISSDRIRIDMGLAGQYSSHDKQLVYKRILEKAEHFLKCGCDIIIDTTFASASFRTSVQKMARPWTDEVFWIRTTAEDETIYKRMATKRNDSEADYAVYLTLKSQFEPVAGEHLVLPTDQFSDMEMIDQVTQYCGLTNDRKPNPSN
ncbi:MAG: ATP-binding protein [Saprospiraceae bacterium]|nr:ATP-binding protein [Saprospiraceae bacterium]